ncbi:MAG: GNAT family N-acetyltransferase [Rhodobacteraceae bacterium]|nr:GNAT family N-acetyltransferase [Alphaproteobacteria bacterium]NNK68508.1 GNAT family N-acetyltransferase [Paracoccaceae bacterium]
MAASDFAHLTTPRLRLTPVTEVDPADVVAGIGNYDVARWLGRVPYPYGLDDAAAFIAANTALAGRVWFIHDADGLVGGISIDRELGYWLSRTAWGQGYATEAGDAVVDVHFADPVADDLLSGHYPGNDRSAVVLKKLGFTYTGRRTVQSAALGQTIDGHELVLTRAAWQARRHFTVDTDRLRLRTLKPGDWRRLQQFGGDPDVARMMLHLTVPWPEAAVKQWIAGSTYRGRPGFRLAICLADGALIGTVGLGPDRSVAFMLDRRYWGKGYATEAMRGFLAECFTRFDDLDTLEADHFTDNPNSGAVLRKLGFERTGTGLGASKARVERAPNVLYRLTRDRFKAVP